MIATGIYEKINSFYWVADDPHSPRVIATNWIFSTTEPTPVPNPHYHWRHPTYEETNSRQTDFDLGYLP